jgi:hypothetical protein
MMLKLRKRSLAVSCSTSGPDRSARWALTETRREEPTTRRGTTSALSTEEEIKDAVDRLSIWR